MCSTKPAVRTGGTFSATDQPCCGLTPCQQAEPTSSQELHFGKFQEPAMPSSWAHHLRPRFPDYSLHHPLSCCSHLPVWGPARSIQLLSASLLPSDSVFQEFWAPIHRPPPIRHFPYPFSRKLPIGQYWPKTMAYLSCCQTYFLKPLLSASHHPSISRRKISFAKMKVFSPLTPCPRQPQSGCPRVFAPG